MEHIITHQSIPTSRTDLWWLKPAVILIAGGGAVLYLLWAAVQGENYAWGPYVSPVYAAPLLPNWWKISPAFLLLWIPVGFRATCYYARKMYYRAAFWDPANCAVDEPYRKSYQGESAFPFVLNNAHRFFLVLALALVSLHWYEWAVSLRHQGAWYMGTGTFIVLTDTLALTLYVFSCHSLRHFIGGSKRCVSCGCGGRVRLKSWQKLSFLNQFHGLWFWISLFSIAAADVYVRMLAMGVIGGERYITF